MIRTNKYFTVTQEYSKKIKIWNMILKQSWGKHFKEKGKR